MHCVHDEGDGLANFQLVDGIACGQSGDTVEVLLGDGRLRFEHHGLFGRQQRTVTEH